jgi:hypothetical protein
VVATCATIFRNNVGFHAKRAEHLFEHRFGLYRELEYWRQKYGMFDAFLKRLGWFGRSAAGSTGNCRS